MTSSLCMDNFSTCVPHFPDLASGNICWVHVRLEFADASESRVDSLTTDNRDSWACWSVVGFLGLSNSSRWFVSALAASSQCKKIEMNWHVHVLVVWNRNRCWRCDKSWIWSYVLHLQCLVLISTNTYFGPTLPSKYIEGYCREPFSG